MTNMTDTIISKPGIKDESGASKKRKFGYFETMGNKRQEQEDALVGFGIETAVLPHPEGIKMALVSTYVALDEGLQYEPQAAAAGTTAITVVYDGQEHLVTALVADAAAFAAVYDLEGKVLKVVRLNSIVHKPDNPDEKQRIEDAGGQITPNNRLMGPGPTLAVSRALGDHIFNKNILISLPQIDTLSLPELLQDVKINQQPATLAQVKIQVITTCDGFTDAIGQNANKEQHELYLNDCLTRYSGNKESEQDLAAFLARQAIQDGSEDNVSVAVQTLVAGEACCLGVYDGHGGNWVSHYVADNIMELLLRNCRMFKQLYPPAVSKADNSKQDLAQAAILDIRAIAQEAAPVTQAPTLLDAQRIDPAALQAMKDGHPDQEFFALKQKLQNPNADFSKLFKKFITLVNAGKDEHSNLAQEIFQNLKARAKTARDHWKVLQFQLKHDSYRQGINKFDRLVEIAQMGHLQALRAVASHALTGRAGGERIDGVTWGLDCLYTFQEQIIPALKHSDNAQDKPIGEILERSLGRILKRHQIERFPANGSEAFQNLANRLQQEGYDKLESRLPSRSALEIINENNQHVKELVLNYNQTQPVAEPVIEDAHPEPASPASSNVPPQTVQQPAVHSSQASSDQDRKTQQRVDKLLGICQKYRQHLESNIYSVGDSEERKKEKLAHALTTLLGKKHAVMQTLEDILANKNNSPEDKLNKFKQYFYHGNVADEAMSPKALIGERRNKLAAWFLSGVETIFGKGFTCFGLWKVKGQGVSEQIKREVPPDNETPSL
ncbi:PP2C family serine/threonine-protein phosphatase [Legionella dresdenensis]|uniref:PP2C family serine/threonine-protein phosphatase n=1 Tax=Legionella dresdenensis TaxID=450200 RepID=A0ABV8CGA8_9GAMM